MWDWHQIIYNGVENGDKDLGEDLFGGFQQAEDWIMSDGGWNVVGKENLNKIIEVDWRVEI
jgi:hypothetical protein